MGIFLFKLIVALFIFFITDHFTYKYIRYVDKKERKKIDKHELDQVEKLNKKMEELNNG